MMELKPASDWANQRAGPFITRCEGLWSEVDRHPPDEHIMVEANGERSVESFTAMIYYLFA